MLKYADYDIVFQELPNEVTLAINISNCPNHCPGCHSAYLMQNVGQPLTDDSLTELIAKYEGDITCVCFMGGDAEPLEVMCLARYVKKQYEGKLKTGWYSGKDKLPEAFPIKDFDYIKIGGYKEELGPLKSETTNQRLYKVVNESEMQDVTSWFWKK